MEENDNNNTLKNNKKLIIGIIIAVCVLVLLVGSFFVINKFFMKDKKLEGYYEVYEMNSRGDDYSNDELENLKSLGLQITLELREDKTGTLKIFGDTIEVTYDDNRIKINDEDNPIKMDKDKIIFEYNGDKITFQKVDKKEYIKEEK